MKPKRWIVLLLALIVLSSAAVAQPQQAPEPVHAVENGRSLSGAVSTLQTIIDLIDQRYVEPAAMPDIVESAADAIVDTLGDPYSDYLPPKEYEHFEQSIDARFGGIGIKVEKLGRYVTVVAPLDGTPAGRADIKPGDRILAVDGRSVVDQSVQRVAELIRGPAGSKVGLTIERDQRSFELELMREIIQLDTVSHERLTPDTGYLRIQTFGQETGAEVRRALAALEGVSGLIVDLRNNPGGLLSAAVSVSDQLVPEGPIVHLVTRDGRKTLRTDGAPVDIPLVILVDEGTASASEIVASAIQDAEAGWLAGQPTFGKGSVQQVIRLDNGGALKLTTAHYLSRAGRTIEGQGIEPDLRLSPETDLLQAAQDLLLWERLETTGPEIQLQMNNQVMRTKTGLKWLPQPPIEINGSLFIPLRPVAESLDRSVRWHPASKAAFLEGNQNDWKLRNGMVPLRGSVPFDHLPSPVIQNGHMLVSFQLLEAALPVRVERSAGGSISIHSKRSEGSSIETR